MNNDSNFERVTTPTYRTEQRSAPRSGTSFTSTPKTTGHDTVLRAIQNKGTRITVIFLSGEQMSGVLIARDKYTLTVRTDAGVRHVVFKHSIERFYGDESAPSEVKGV